MRNRTVHVLCALVLALGACSSGGDSAQCSYDDPTQLADSPWPKFSRDAANTGRVHGVTIPATPSQLWTFPSLDEPGIKPISTAALVGNNSDIYLVAGSDESFAATKLYVLDATTGEVRNYVTPTPAPDPIPSPADVPPTLSEIATATASPLLGADGTIYVGFSDGNLGRFESNGKERNSAALGGYIAAAPNIGTKGTVYQGTLGGSFSGVCPNGVPSFVRVSGAVQSSAAVATDGTIFMANAEGQVRALDTKGRQLWVFFATGPVLAAVVLDEGEESGSRVYVEDMAGRVFALHASNGESLWHQRVPSNAPISASPALGKDTIYVADEGGSLWALATDTGELLWTCSVPASIKSSPAVASSADRDIVVFGADDGLLYAVDSAAALGCGPEVGCSCEDVAQWTFTLEAPVGRASPSLGSDGTVYLGTQGGHLYAIGAPPDDSGSSPTPTATPTPIPTP